MRTLFKSGLVGVFERSFGGVIEERLSDFRQLTNVVVTRKMRKAHSTKGLIDIDCCGTHRNDLRRVEVAMIVAGTGCFRMGQSVACVRPTVTLRDGAHFEQHRPPTADSLLVTRRGAEARKCTTHLHVLCPRRQDVRFAEPQPGLHAAEPAAQAVPRLRVPHRVETIPQQSHISVDRPRLLLQRCKITAQSNPSGCALEVVDEVSVIHKRTEDPPHAAHHEHSLRVAREGRRVDDAVAPEARGGGQSELPPDVHKTTDVPDDVVAGKGNGTLGGRSHGPSGSHLRVLRRHGELGPRQHDRNQKIAALQAFQAVELFKKTMRGKWQ